MPFELSWIPGGSVGFLINLFGFFKLIIVVVRRREVVLKTSIIVFDIAQFFPSLNHSMLTFILSHFGFANCIVDFFSDYLVGRSTQYSWNFFLSGACNADVGMGQGSALSPILSALYIAPLIRIFEYRAQVLNLDTCILSFVDDGLLIS